MTSEKIEALEIALAHAEASIEDLSEVAQRQGAEIEALRREIGKLTRTLEAMLEDRDEDAPPADQKPPHY
ncbi:MAG: SlyX family protein [Pseudomonadota bacterium]